MYIFLQFFDVEHDVTVVCLCMFNVYVFLLQIISFQASLPWWLAQVFRATHGLPPCDDESYDPYGPYGDLGDVETDEVLALDSQAKPNKKSSFVPKRFRCTAVGRVWYEATKLHSLRRTFRVNWSFVNIWLPGSLPGTWALSPIPTGTISFGRVKGAQKLSEGWMDVDGRCRCGIQSSSVQWFEIISQQKVTPENFALRSLDTRFFGVYMICYCIAGPEAYCRLIESLNEDGYSMHHDLVFFAIIVQYLHVILLCFAKMAGSGVWA